jgi:hypothetical protein
MTDAVVPTAGMTISIRSRRDVVVVDPDHFMAAARRALCDLDPNLTEAQAAEAIGDVYDAAHALLDRDGQLADEEDVARAVEIGPGRDATMSGMRVSDRADGLSPAGWIQQIVLDDPMPLQAHGCFLPNDPFALPVTRPTPGDLH